MRDLGLREDFLKLERRGKRAINKIDSDEESSSPRRHCPQKAVAAQAAIAMSKGSLRSKRWISCMTILALTGGRGGCLEPRGIRL